MIDDAHWIDAASVAVLTDIASRLRSAALLLVIARRRVEGRRDPLDEPLRMLGRDDRILRVPVGRLTRDEVRELVRLAALPEWEVADLLAASDGVPLVIAELLGARHEAVPTTVRAPDQAEGEESARHASEGEIVRDTPGPFFGRLERLSDEASQVLAAAAVVDRTVGPDLVGEVSGRSVEETTRALEELVRAGFLVEHAAQRVRGDDHGRPDEVLASGYDFDHPHTRELAYARLGLARRRHLHRRAADALARDASRPGAGTAASEVARQYELAGDERRAAAFLAEAGRRAEEIWANAEALGHYRAAAALDPQRVGELRERMADLETLLGRYSAAVRELEAAVATTRPDDALAKGRLERKLAAVHRRQGEFALAETHAALALVCLPMAAVSERLLAVLEQGLLAQRQSDLEAASSFAATALELAARVPEDALGARARNVAGMVARARGDLDQAGRHLRRSLELATSAGSLEARAAALNNLALVEREAGRTQEAIEFTEAALRICLQVGDRHREAALRNNLADLLHSSGRDESAMDQLRQAVTILADLGEPGQLQPEIWRLVEW